LTHNLLVNDVAYPFKDSMQEYKKRSEELFSSIKDSIISLVYDNDRFQKIKWKYEDTSSEFVKALYKYTDFKRQSTEASSVFYKNKLFNELGSHLLTNEEKAIE